MTEVAVGLVVCAAFSVLYGVMEHLGFDLGELLFTLVTTAFGAGCLYVFLWIVGAFALAVWSWL